MKFASQIPSTKFSPFGVTLTNRNFTSSSYRYGFNGMEKDDEVKGSGNSYDYEMRFYDNRLGRFLSIDPVANYYPSLSTYQFASNTPIWAVDLDGLEKVCGASVGPLSDGYISCAFKATQAAKIESEKNKVTQEITKQESKIVPSYLQSVGNEIAQVHQELFFSEAPREVFTEDYKIAQEGIKSRTKFMSNFSDFETGMIRSLKEGAEIGTTVVGGMGALKGMSKAYQAFKTGSMIQGVKTFALESVSIHNLRSTEGVLAFSTNLTSTISSEGILNQMDLSSIDGADIMGSLLKSSSIFNSAVDISLGGDLHVAGVNKSLANFTIDLSLNCMSENLSNFMKVGGTTLTFGQKYGINSSTNTLTNTAIEGIGDTQEPKKKED